MSKKALTALHGSIKHWERLSSGNRDVDEVPDSEFCPLCAIYLDDDCTRCPVYLNTRLFYCKGTPYLNALVLSKEYTALDSDDFKDAAKLELEFLKSLLPTE